MSDFREMSMAGKEGCKRFLWFNLLMKTFSFVLKSIDEWNALRLCFEGDLESASLNERAHISAPA